MSTRTPATPANGNGRLPRVLTPAMVERIRAYFDRYPSRQAATLPALHVVNDELRCVPREAVPEIAELLELHPAEVQDTLTFYGYFHQDKPHGATRAWICRSISCALRGADDVLEHACERLGVKPGGTTPDGRVTLDFAECLGACEFAPCMLAGRTLHKNLTRETAAEILETLRKIG
jgi:NADH-quinone oxidoreductase subunit E